MIFNGRVLLLSALISAGFLGGTVFAAAKLPSVNVAKGSVSARELFGEQPIEREEGKGIREEEIVAIKTTSQKPVASNQKISTSYNDVLVPQRPNGDLWARSSDNRGVVARGALPEQKLRMPDPSEFITMGQDFALPEEHIDYAFDGTENRRANNEDDMFAASRFISRSRSQAATVRPAPVQPGQEKQDAPELRKIQTQPTGTKPGPVIQNRFAPAPRAAIEPAGEVFVRRVVVPMDEERESGVGSRESWDNPGNDIYSSLREEKSYAQNRKASTTYDSRLTTPDEDEVPLSKMSPMQLKRAFQKTYISENRHLSTYKIDDRFDVASDVDFDEVGFDSSADFSERGGIRPLEIKIGFRGTDAALSRDNFNLLSEYAGIVVSNPKRAIQVSIPESGTRSFDGRRLAARRLAIIEQTLKDAGVSDQRIIPVLSQRSDNSFVLRVISNDMFQTLSEKQRDMFGDVIKTREQRSLRW